MLSPIAGLGRSLFSTSGMTLGGTPVGAVSSPPATSSLLPTASSEWERHLETSEEPTVQALGSVSCCPRLTRLFVNSVDISLLGLLAKIKCSSIQLAYEQVYV
ncbi:mCG20000, isoform CRA_c [Mus musculus]|nr:mCG20000, isoform CRA_c [Mus musculus]